MSISSSKVSRQSTMRASHAASSLTYSSSFSLRPFVETVRRRIAGRARHAQELRQFGVERRLAAGEVDDVELVAAA